MSVRLKLFNPSQPDVPLILLSNAVDSVTGNVAANAVDNAQLAYNAVHAEQIQANAVTSAKIAFNAVGSDQLADASVDSSALQANSVVSSKIAYNAVDNAQLAYNSVDNSQLAYNAVHSAQIQANAVTTAKINIDANLSANSNKITNLSDGAALGDAVNYGQLQAVAAQGKVWKEALLSASQLVNGVSGGIYAANVLTLSTNLATGDTITLHDGTTSENYVADTDFSVGGSINATLANLQAAINGGAIAVSSVTGLLSSLDATNDVLVLWQDTIGQATRVYGNAGAAAKVNILPVAKCYDGLAADLAALPSADPAVTNFGFSRVTASLVVQETHSCRVDDVTYTWDGDVGLWNNTGSAAVPVATKALAGKVQISDGIAVSAGIISADVDTADGIQLTGSTPNKKIAAKYDNSTIGINAGNLYVKPNGITSSQIATNAVGAAQLADDAVDSAAILANAVVTSKIAYNAVDNAQLAFDSVHSDQIQANSVVAAKIAYNAVGANQLADDAVDTGAILANAVTSAKIAFNAITASQLADDAVDTAAIQANAVTSAKIAFNAITASQLASDSVYTAALQANAVTGAKIAYNTITEVNASVGIKQKLNNLISATGVGVSTPVAGEIVFIDNADDLAKKAQADVAANCDGKLYFVETANGTALELRDFGTVAGTGLNTTQPIYLSAATAGAITQTAPSASGNVVILLGYATDVATSWKFAVTKIGTIA